jgi:hypothetical protein
MEEFVNEWKNARPPPKTVDAQEKQFIRGLQLYRRSSGNSVSAKGLARCRFFVGRRKPRDRHRRQQFHLRHGLRHRDMADVAYLAMLLV